MEPNSRKTSETSQRKVSSSDPFKDMPIVWVMGKYIKISGSILLLEIIKCNIAFESKFNP